MRGDRRAATVQIGAILLLAIVIAALAVYQLNAVPDQNRNVEIDHNQAVHDEMQDLRNAIHNVGATEGSRATAISLGTQYPTRAVAVNPPAPTGTLETTGERTLRIENAQLVGNYEGEGDPEDLLGAHPTTTIEYTPDYHEYRDAPVTRIEHAAVFNEFASSSLPVAERQLADNDTISITLLSGSISESGAGATSIDTRTLSGPTDPVTIEPDDGADHIAITLPTDDPAYWTDELGDTWGDNGMRVVDEGNDGDDAVEIEFENDSYDLRLSRVGLAGGGERSDGFDVRAPAHGGEGQANRTFAVDWQTEDVTLAERADGEPFDLTVTDSETGGPIGDAAVEFATASEGGVSIDRGASDERTNGAGIATAVLDADSVGSTAVYGSSGDDAAKLDVTVEPPESEPGFAQLEADPRGNVNGMTFTYVPTGLLDDSTVEFALYDGEDVSGTQLDSATDSDPDAAAENVLELTDFNTDTPVTVEAVLVADGVAVTCTGTGDDNSEISIEDGGIDCTSESPEGTFSVSIDAADDSVAPGDEIEVAYTVTNDGDARDTQDVEFTVDGTTEDVHPDLSLESGETDSDVFTYETTEDERPEITIGVSSDDDGESRTVAVAGTPHFDVEITDSNSSVEVGDSVVVDATVHNTGDGPGTQSVVLEIDGDVVDDGDGPVSLEAGEGTAVTRTWDEATEGNYEVTIASDDDADSDSIFVEPPGVPGFTLSAVLLVILLVTAAKRRRDS